MLALFPRLAVWISVVVGLAPGTAYPKSLEEAMRDTARALSRQLARRDAEVVHVSVDGPPGDGAAKRMQQSFVRSLRSADSDLEVSGAIPDYEAVLEYRRSPESDEYSMKVELRDGDNNVIGQYADNFRFTDPVERAVVEGSTFDNTIDPLGRFQIATDDAVSASFAAPPSVFVSGNPAAGGGTSIVSPRKGSRFRMEVLARPKSSSAGYVPRAVNVRRGYALCPLRDGEVYAVRIYNDATHAVAVDLSIDGISMWTTSEVPEWRRLGKFLVPARSSVTIYGWHVGSRANPNAYGEFEIVDFPESLVAELGADRSALGQIQAQFFAAWRPGEPQPEADPIGVMGGATGIGCVTNRVTLSQRVHIGRTLLAAVTVRYVRLVRDESGGP